MTDEQKDITEPCTPEGISEWAYTAANRSEGLSISQGVRLRGMIESAMHTYAQEVMKWVSENCTYNSEIMMWGYKDDLYNYEQLIELFIQQNQK